MNKGTKKRTSTQTYFWGTDLSGTPQGAGGVGGLLAVTDFSGDTDETYFPFYDGNGNVTGYADASDGSLSCSFDYGPFGEPVKATGQAADKLDFRFSTKYQDPATGIVHFELRPLDTQTGRWSTRDPIEEQGGINLYGFVDNDAVNFFDYLGQRKLAAKIRGILESRMLLSISTFGMYPNSSQDLYYLQDDENEMTPRLDYDVAEAIAHYAKTNNKKGWFEITKLGLRKCLRRGNFVYHWAGKRGVQPKDIGYR